MNIPENWLRSFVDPKLNTAKLAHLLTMSGLEVESFAPVAPPFSGVVVGEILAVERHPNADKLTVCTVDTGKEKLKVVCGAPNVRVGCGRRWRLLVLRLKDLEIKEVQSRGIRKQRHALLRKRARDSLRDHSRDCYELAEATRIAGRATAAYSLD
jgi:phenylalanyl-tRNA synthetase beta chain